MVYQPFILPSCFPFSHYQILTIAMIRILSFLLLTLSFVFLLPSCINEPHDDAPEWKHNGNTLRIRQPTAITTLNPFLYRLQYESDIHKLIFQAPMEIEHETFDLTPVFVKAQPIVKPITTGANKGGQSFTYEILNEAVWDDGKPITGNDFLFSMKAIFNPKLPTAQIIAYFDNVMDVEVDAENPKKFTVFTNNTYVLSKPGISNFIVLPEHIYDAEGLLKSISFKELRNPEMADKMADNENIQNFATAFTDHSFATKTISGSGPYEVAEWEVGQRVVLTKKKNWWGTKFAGKNTHLTAHPDTIIFYPIPDQAATITALKDESIDFSAEIDVQQFLELSKDEFVEPIYDFKTRPTYTYFMTVFNTRNPKLSDKRVRRALAHVLDMDLVIEELYNGLGERTVGPVFADKKYLNKSLQHIQFDLEKASQLLKEAGWEDTNGNGTVDKNIDGELTEMKLSFQYVPTSNFQNTYSELFKNNAQKIGVEIEREGLEFKAMIGNGRSGDFEIMGRATRWLPLPDDFKQLWHTDGIGGHNFPRFGNAETDALIDAIRYNPNDEERNEQYMEFQKILYDEQPVIFQLIPLDRVVSHKRFEPAMSRMGVSPQHFKLKESKIKG